MKYRDHRGSLEEALKTEKEINAIEDLENHINESWGVWDWTVTGIKFEYVGLDKRIGWDTHYVLAKFDKSDWIVVGMSDGKL